MKKQLLTAITLSLAISSSVSAGFVFPAPSNIETIVCLKGHAPSTRRTCTVFLNVDEELNEIVVIFAFRQEHPGQSGDVINLGNNEFAVRWLHNGTKLREEIYTGIK